MTIAIKPIKNATTSEKTFSAVVNNPHINPTNIEKLKAEAEIAIATFRINSQRFILFSSVVDRVIVSQLKPYVNNFVKLF